MRKIILLFLSLLLFTFSFAVYKGKLEKYYSKTTIEKVENYLDNWNNKILKTKSPEIFYDKVIWKIDNFLQKKNISLKTKTVLLYLKEKINFFKSEYMKTKEVKKQKVSNEDKIVKKTEEKKVNNYKKLSNVYFLNNGDYILVPIENRNYVIANINMKALYGNSLLYSILFKNVYWNQSDSLIKKAYFIDDDKNILAEWNFVNGVVYFQLKSPKLLTKDISTRFYVVVSLNTINSLQNTNKKIKLWMLKTYNSFDTKIVSVDNGNDTNFYVTNFYPDTYFIRKAKLIVKSENIRKKLYLWTNDIYSFEISSTGWDVSLLNLVLKSHISPRANIVKDDVEVLIDGKKYDKLNAYFDKENKDANLYIKFNSPYTIWTKAKKITIKAVFKRAKEDSYIYTRFEKRSKEENLVNGNYTWTYSILWSDNAYKWALTSDVNGFYTENLLDFSNVKDWYLRK